MTEKELLLRIKAATDNASFGKVKDHIGSLGGVAATAGKVMAVGLAAGAVAVGVIAAASWSAVKSAEALADAQARVGLVFGKEAQGVIEDNATIANSLGMTKTAYLDSVGAMGQYAVNLGLNKDAAADMAMGLTELAPKIAAYAGAEQGAVNDALQKALGGKTKALEAMGYHIEKAPKGLSDAAAAEFVYAQVLAQSANAQKAWNDNAGDTDVSLARIGASFEDAKAKAGTLIAAAVAPYLKGVADAASELSAAFQTGGLDGLVAKFAELTGIDLSGWLDALQQKWADVVAAFQDGGIVAALSEIVGFDVQPLIDNAIALKDSFLAFWHDAIEPTAAFITGTVIPAIMDLAGWLAKHKEILVGVAAGFVTLKAAMAIQAVFAGVSGAATLGAKALVVWGNVAKLAGIQTLSFSTALKIAAGPLGWLILAVGLFAAAWAGNWGGIREKTAAVVEWIKTIPAQLSAGWNQLKADLAAMVASWQAKWTDVKAHPVKAFGEVMAFLGTLPMRMTKKGLDIVLGLLGGLKDGWNKLVGWWKGKQGDIPGAVVKHHDMASPSKLMLKLGFWITEGLALGILAGGVLATQAMAQTLTDLDRANAGVTGGRRVADAAKAAVEAALLADGIIKGKYESYSEAWGRYYEEMTRQETALNELNVNNIEKRRKEALDFLNEQLAGNKALAEAEGIRIARLIQNVRDSEQRNGLPQAPEPLKDFDNVWRQSAENLRPLLEFLNGGKHIDEIDTAFRDFWVNFNGGAVSGIANSQQLTEAITALVDAVGKKYDKLFKDTEDGFNREAASEEERHKRVIENLNQRRAFIDALIQEQEHADANLSQLIAIRDALLAQAKTAIANAQKAAEEFENRVHDGVMAAIAQERAAQTGAHKARMIQLEDERKAIDAGHERRLGQLQAQRDAITKGFKERHEAIDRERTALSQLKLDLGVEDAALKLTSLKEQLQDLRSVMDSFQVATRGRAALDQQRSAMVDRVRVTTDAQRKALQDVLASGTLDDKDRRRVELLLLGRGTQRAADVRRILGAGADVLQQQINAQQAIVDAHTQIITAKERAIELSEQQLKIDEQNAQARLDEIDQLITAENTRYDNEVIRLNARITLEQQRFDAEMDFLDRISDAEGRRHDQRMVDIASEYALELAKLGMSQAEIDAMIGAAQREAARIATETAAALAALRAADRGGLAEAGGLGLAGAGGFDMGLGVALQSPAARSFTGGLNAFAGAINLAQSSPLIVGLESVASSLAVVFADAGPALAGAIVSAAPGFAQAVSTAMARPKPKHGADDEEYWMSNSYGDVRHHYADRQRYLRDRDAPEGSTGSGTDTPDHGAKPNGIFNFPGLHVDSADVDHVDFGGLSIEGTTVILSIDGKEFAAQVVKTIAGDAVLLDTLGKPLSERAARKAQTP